MSVKIERFCAYPIDRTAAKVIKETIPHDANLDKYLAALVELTTKEEETRQFFFAQTTTEARAALTRIRTNNEIDASAETIAARLLRIEKTTFEKVAHLRGVQDGILFQSLFERDGEQGMLIAKVDWAHFLTKGSYRDADGIDYKPRLLKACLIQFSDGDKIDDVQIADTNPTLSSFWWKDFLELEEKRTDESNTKAVFAAFDSFLGSKLQSKHPADYTHLFNDMLRIFKREKRFSFKKFIGDVFDGYRVIDPKLDIKKLKQDSERLLEKKTFDATFNLAAETITKRFKRTYTLTDEIELQISNSIENLETTVFGLGLQDGTKGVFVKSEKGYNQFLRPPVLQKAQKPVTTATTKHVKNQNPNKVHLSN
jgi:hypothetical protein